MKNLVILLIFSFVPLISVCAKIKVAQKRITFAGEKLIPNDTVIIKKDTLWNIGGVGNLSFSQAQYSEYWVQGGENSFSLLADFKLLANFRKGKSAWDNLAIFEYGTLKSEAFDGFRKSSDRIEVNSKYGYQASKFWFYSVLASYKTQFTNGYEYAKKDSLEDKLISGFNAPGYLFFAIGMDYKRSENLSILVSPFTSKFTFVAIDSIDETTYGLDEGASMNYELGAYIKAVYKWNITDNIYWENHLDLFTNYLANPEKVDVDWESKLFLNINEYLTTTLSTRLIWDYDIKFTDVDGEEFEKVQFKEILSLGFSYKF